MWSIANTQDAAANPGENKTLVEYLRETKEQLEAEKLTKTLKYQAQIDKLSAELSKYNKPYHATQRKHVELELQKLHEELHAVDMGRQWDSVERQSQKYVQLSEQEQLLEKIEMSVGQSGISHRHVDYSNMCITKLQNRAPTIQIKNVPTCSTPSCREQILTYDSIHSTLLCPKCGRTQTFIDATSNLTAYGDEVEITSFSYKKLTHFNDHLTFAQGKESTRVPDAIILQICAELKNKMGFRKKDYITVDDVSKAMKQLKLRKYYKNRVQIHSKITGRPPRRLTPVQQQRIVHRFRQMQPIFEQRCPTTRSLPYRYCLHRLCEYEGLPEFQHMFALPKNEKKLEAFDNLFVLIIQDLHWDRSRFVLSMDLPKKPKQNRAAKKRLLEGSLPEGESAVAPKKKKAKVAAK